MVRGGDDAGSARIRPGTARRTLAYLRSYGGSIAAFGLVAAVEAVIVVATPLLLKAIVDDGILKNDLVTVARLAGVVAGLALIEGLAQLVLSRISGRIGQGVSRDLRVQAHDHVQRLPLAFFTRTQAGVLSSRMHTDIVVAQHAFTQVLMSATAAVTVVLVVAELFYLSWLVAVAALMLIPIFLVPWAYVGRRLQRHQRRQMELQSGLAGLIHERFNVQGAMLTKLFGRPAEELADYADRAERIRRIGVTVTVYGRLAFIIMALLASLATAVVYGVGGGLVLDGAFQLGTLVALAILLGRLFGPITQLSGMQAGVLNVLVSFDRVFELLDLKPLITERPGAVALPSSGAAPDIEFKGVRFRYPRADEVSLESLEANAHAVAEREDDSPEVLRGVDFRIPSGTVTALVGPSGAGKTTLAHLVSRLYDPTSGAVRLGGHDVRDLTFESLRRTVGVVSQDSYLFHDTIRENLRYARPEATEEELVEACERAQIWDVIKSLPRGLDTVVGDRGYRMSGGEKQRLAIARLLLKSPSVVVLDEATAHLDSESEAAVQRALVAALQSRTALVIAHRLSTVREADQILVIDDGGVRERGTHEELLRAGGLYAGLYHTQLNGNGAARHQAVAVEERR